MSAPKDKGLVMVNGAKVEVDVEEMAERDLKSLTKQKRVKPTSPARPASCPWRYPETESGVGS